MCTQSSVRSGKQVMRLVYNINLFTCIKQSEHSCTSLSTTVTCSRVLLCVFTGWQTLEKPSTGPSLIKRALTTSGGPMKAGFLIQDQAW